MGAQINTAENTLPAFDTLPVSIQAGFGEGYYRSALDVNLPSEQLTPLFEQIVQCKGGTIADVERGYRYGIENWGDDQTKYMIGNSPIGLRTVADVVKHTIFETARLEHERQQLRANLDSVNLSELSREDLKKHIEQSRREVELSELVLYCKLAPQVLTGIEPPVDHQFDMAAILPNVVGLARRLVKAGYVKTDDGVVFGIDPAPTVWLSAI